MTQVKTKREPIYFDAIKESRSSYFVEYRPPISDGPISTLNIVYPESFELNSVAETMKVEAVYWLARYPVPIMIWAYDSAENQIRPHGDDDDGLLIGWYPPGSTTFTCAWKVAGSPDYINDGSRFPDWREIYKDVPYRTDAMVKANAWRELKVRRKQNLTLKALLAVWLAAIPAAWAVIQYLGPDWLALAVLMYSLWQAAQAARKLYWRVEPTKIEKEKEEKDLKMRHYFYHCERNPRGFSRLLVENFEEDARERVREEAESLRSKP